MMVRIEYEGGQDDAVRHALVHGGVAVLRREHAHGVRARDARGAREGALAHGELAPGERRTGAADATADGIPAARRSRGWRFMLASEAELGRARRVLLDGDEAFARVQGYLCDAAAIAPGYREHVGPPSKPLRSQIRDLQRALGRTEVPGVPTSARLLAEEKEEGAEDGARKVKEDWGDVDEEAW